MESNNNLEKNTIDKLSYLDTKMDLICRCIDMFLDPSDSSIKLILMDLTFLRRKTFELCSNFQKNLITIPNIFASQQIREINKNLDLIIIDLESYIVLNLHYLRGMREHISDDNNEQRSNFQIIPFKKEINISGYIYGELDRNYRLVNI